MNKYVLAGIFVLIFIVGLAVIFNNASVGFDDVMRSLKDMNPRVMSILALPIIAVLFGLGVYWRKKSEERMWKKAVRKTRTNSGTET
ncbi:MAG: hypothetical protein GY732_07040 [Gammaproteobacteria bacterium]|nr:hypothetical protein [Gammaproteobacteria bacterium]